jgi:tetratricopeptide (TPR) repeat protein
MRTVPFLIVVALAVAAPARAEENENSKIAKAHYMAGVKHYNIGDYQDALTAFKSAYLRVADPVFLFNMGQCYRQLGDHDNAARQYRAYLRERPNAPNRVEVERFIAAADEQLALQRKNVNLAPTGVERVETPQEPPPPAVQPRPAPAPAVTPAIEKPPEKKSRWWIGVVAGVGAAVVVGAVAVGVAYALPNDAPVPTGTTSGATVTF